MPGITGIELAHQIHEIRADLPLILCSGFSQAAHEAQGRLVGIREFIDKPIHPNKLGWAIRRAIDTNQAG